MASGVMVLSLSRSVRLATLCANSGAGSASDACARVCNRHHLALDLIIAIKIYQLAVFIDALQIHDRLSADLETSATADTGL